MLHDKLTISVRAGRGGDGAVSFRREAHVPRGGVDGGDGGKGGDVILRADGSRRDLAHLRRKRRYFATDGGAGGKRNRHGADGDDLIVAVPVGTQAFVDGRTLCDLTVLGDESVIAAGGSGGRGNTNFVSSVRRAPAFAELGMPGDEFEIELRLKLMADAALVGLPNAGKSSLLRRISNAKPKVGNYPFTTLAPVLGTLERPDGSQIVVADVPGLLEGASEGYGLGHEFLAHLERARLIAHLVSLEDGDTAAERFATIQNELWAYDPRIARLPQVIVLSKCDLVQDDEVERVRAAIEERAIHVTDHMGPIVAVVAVSSATSRGLTELVQHLFRAVTHLDEDEAGAPQSSPAALEEYRVYRPRPKRRPWRIFRSKDGLRVSADPELSELARAATRDDEAYERLYTALEENGVLRALAQAGVRQGTVVTIGDSQIEL